ncbi:hypothetical protein RHGRI_035598 [Rhododendron griersonianum]|uniref:IBB domain-containing protein n=1 Tax=Rhododendron griersonianum TaxID=479676 RepID=A0AAV6HMR0_9ERIC|nr:hypothetical protein RHGRI_035598 [Rhododendron griersonianum]
MSSLQLVEYRKKSYKVALDLEEASQRREDDLEEVRHSKCDETLLNKFLQSKLLFSDASQTHGNGVDTLEMAVAKAGFEHTECKDEAAAAALAISKGCL